MINDGNITSQRRPPALANCSCAACASVGQEFQVGARQKTPLFGDQLRRSASPQHVHLIGSVPRSGRSSSQQEARENNPARFQFLSDRGYSRLISLGCCFCCCKPVIIRGKQRTRDASGGERIYFHRRQAKTAKCDL